MLLAESRNAMMIEAALQSELEDIEASIKAKARQSNG